MGSVTRVAKGHTRSFHSFSEGLKSEVKKTGCRWS